MPTHTQALLDEVRKRHGLTSDNKLAQFFGWDRARVSHYRTGRRELDGDACLQVADALDLDHGYVLACVQISRERSAPVKKAWSTLAKDRGKKASAIAALACGALIGGLAPRPADAGLSAHNV